MFRPASLLVALAMFAPAHLAQSLPTRRKLPKHFVLYAEPTAEELRHCLAPVRPPFTLSGCRRRLFSRKGIRMANKLAAAR